MKQFTVWVDRQDGDVYEGEEAVGQAVAHALKAGALRVVVKPWPSDKKPKKKK